MLFRIEAYDFRADVFRLRCDGPVALQMQLRWGEQRLLMSQSFCPMGGSTEASLIVMAP